MNRAFRMLFLLFGALSAIPDALAQDLANPLTASVTSRYRTARQNLVESAELMPAASYEFRLTPEQRTFAEWLTHTAMGNYAFCGAIAGQAAQDTASLAKLKTKAEIEEALRKSFEPCDSALDGMTDAKALAPIRQRERTVYPVQGMIALIASLNEHYGNLVGYLRTKGITPPSTARKDRPVTLPERKQKKDR